MSRVVLCRPPYSGVYGVYNKVPEDREVRVPLGLLYLAGALEKNGHEVKIIDGEPKLLSPTVIASLADAYKPDFVGISSTTPEFHLAKEVLHLVKLNYPKTTTILGGAHATALPEESLKECPDADYVVVGEGEQSILKIVNDMPKERIIKSPLAEDLETLPRPARHLVDYSDYAYPIPNEGLVRMDTIETTRGCPYHCLFCSHLHGNSVRFREPIKCVDEIEMSIRETGARLFMFYDETFAAKRSRVVELCEEIIRRNLGIQCFCWTRVDSLDYDLLKLMKSTGFNQISIGVESGNQNMLNAMRKGTRLEQYVQVFDWLEELEMEARGSFIVGAPGETPQTIQESIDFARKLKLYRIGVNIMTPYPGSPLYAEMVKGRDDITFASRDWRDYKRWGSAVVETPSLSSADLIAWQKKFLRDFNSSRRVLWYHFRQLFKGNLSYYYYRPILYAVKERLKSVFRGRIKK